MCQPSVVDACYVAFERKWFVKAASLLIKICQNFVCPPAALGLSFNASIRNFSAERSCIRAGKFLSILLDETSKKSRMLIERSTGVLLLSWLQGTDQKFTAFCSSAVKFYWAMKHERTPHQHLIRTCFFYVLKHKPLVRVYLDGLKLSAKNFSTY
jgi:hypothetical protein